MCRPPPTREPRVRTVPQLRRSTGRSRLRSELDRPARRRPHPALAGPRPASHRSPTDPALRANPFPEVTDPICRLPLPTLLLSTRGCSPWRPAADMGTARRENHTFSPGFSRADGSAPDTAGSAVLYGSIVPISGQTDSRECAPYKEKRTLPGAAANVSWFVCVAALDPEGPISASGFGNINPIPFRPARAIASVVKDYSAPVSERRSPMP